MTRARFLAISLLVPASIALAEPEEELRYSRVELVESRTGEVRFQRANVRQISLPLSECPEGPFTCSEARTYRQIYALTFTEERTLQQRGGSPEVERTDRGRLLVAVDLPPPSEGALETAIRETIKSLGIASFSQQWAGLGYQKPPFAQSVLRESAQPAWVCSELNRFYKFEILITRGDSERSFARADASSERGCREIAQALGDLPAETLRTPPAIQIQDRYEVHMASTSTLEGLTWSDGLARIPEGVTFEKTSLAQGKTRSGSTREMKGGTYRGREGRYGGVERNVVLPPASLDLVEVPMWITRWRFDATRETFGAAPLLTRQGSESVVIAVVPVVDPLMDEISRGRTLLQVPEKQIVESAVRRLERGAVLSPALVEEALTDPEIWPASGDWMIVACRDDGSARYGIAPFPAGADVTNAGEACAAILGKLG